MDDNMTKTFKIPGLLQGKKEKAFDKLNQAEVQAIRDRFAQQIKQQDQNYEFQKEVAKIKSDCNTFTDHSLMPSTNGYVVGFDPYHQGQAGTGIANDPNLLLNVPGIGQLGGYAPPMDYGDWYKQQQPSKPLISPRIKPYGPSPSRRDTEYEKDAMKYIQDMIKPKTSPFEEIINAIFSQTEKEQFLIDAGYILEWDNQDGSYDIKRKLNDGSIKTITTPLNELFLKEITVKFKNLLLAKQVLKLKL